MGFVKIIITPKKYSTCYEEYDFKNENDIPKYLCKIILDLISVCENIYFLEKLPKLTCGKSNSVSQTPSKKIKLKK
jgi:uncharacterized protein (DUF983 family)